jgi:tetratricopeptide (TPR) repeat protein
MNRIRTLGPLLALALFCAPAAAQPAPPGPPTSDASPTVVDLDAVEARKAFEEGVIAYQHGDYESAAERFGRAQLLKPHPEVLLNLAQSQLKARKFAEAATNFQSYLAQTQRENATARNGLADARTQVAEISVVAPEGETIYVDQTIMGTAPLPQPLYLVPGRHEFVVGERRQTLTVSAGTTDTVDLVSPPAPVAASFDTSELPPSRPRRMPVDQWFVRRPGAWVGAGITASSLVFSAVSATTAGRRYAAANDAKRQIWDYYAQDGSPGASPCGDPKPSRVYEGPCSYYLDRVESGDSWRTASIVTLIVGVVAASGTVAYYFLDPDNRVDSEPAPPTLDIQADPKTGLYSVALTGRF